MTLESADALIGRDAEVARLHELVDGACAGRGAALVVVAPPGTGRSSLLAAGERQAAQNGAVTWSAAAHPAERSVDGAALSGLAGHDVPREPGEFARYAHRHAGSGPLVIALDDAHLADATSLAALAYLARRSETAAIAVILTAVPDAALATVLAGIPVLALGPLLLRDGARLATATSPMHASVAERLAAVSGGCPLAIVELARHLTPGQREGTAPLPDLPDPGTALTRSFAVAMAALSESCRRALCVAAAEPSGDVTVIARALSRLGDDVQALEPAETAGLVRIGDDRIVFDHPVRRLVAYHLLAAPSRRTAHRALALALDAPHQAERRVQHLVAGAAGPSDTVAGDLELVAHHLAATGRGAAAAEAWGHAARLSTTTADADRRRAEADRLSAGSLLAGSRREPGREPTLGLLSPAERRVAEAVGRGLSNKQAATALFVSAKTIDAHLGSIYRKLRISTRAELAVIVTRHAMGGTQ